MHGISVWDIGRRATAPPGHRRPSLPARRRVGRGRRAAARAARRLGPAARPLLRLRPAQQRPGAALRRGLARALPRPRAGDARRPLAPLPLHARRRGRSRRRCRASGSTGRSPSTRGTRSGATTDAAGWPSLFLWGRGGALRWYHLGEGEYAATEEAIREALAEAGDPGTGWPAPLEPLRPGDAPGARVIAPTRRAVPGGGPERAVDGERGASPRSSSTTRPAAPSSRPTARARSRCGSTGSPASPSRSRASGPARARRARAPRAHTGWSLRPAPGVALYSVQFAPGLRRGPRGAASRPRGRIRVA